MENKFNYKKKFTTNDQPFDNTLLCTHFKSNIIDDESLLLTPSINKREKTQLKLSNNFSPDKYDLLYKDSLNTENDKFEFYYNNKNIGAGRGFGNLNISNEIRNSLSTRKDSKENKFLQEGIQMFDYQFEYINNDYQNSDHIVMPIPRGGVSTRKNISTNKNYNFIF